MRVVLGVCGGIAAYKAVSLLRLFTEAGHDVQVVPTASALRFVGEPTWSALSGRPVAADVWDRAHDVPHVRLGRWSELVVVVPATANTMAKAAAGLADDLLTNLLLTARCPILMAPAMHTEMWEHPATVENVAVLRARGVQVLEPASGRLTGADSGPGRLPEPQEIFDAAFALATPSGHVSSLRGMRLLVTAGGTREPLDPVRFLGNRSSGRQGYALATVARERGGEVTLIAANTALPDPPGVEVVRVSTTAELYDATLAHARDVDAVVMAAAPADFRPVEVAPHKIKKTENGTTPTIRLAENPDILGALVAERASGGLKPAAVLVGFAAETGDERATPLAHGRAKLTRKGCDLLVVNEIGATRGFESEENAGVLLRADGSEREIPIGPKRSLAAVVWEEVVAWRAR